MAKYSVFLLFAIISVVASFPAQPTTEHDNKETDVEFVPLEKQRPGVPHGIIEDDYDIEDSPYFPGGGSFGRFNPFSTSFYDSLEAMMTRMRQQLSQVLNRLPSRGANPGTSVIDVPTLADVDLSKGNTTSVTKIIDGHKVVINETEYNNQDGNGGAFFKIRIIDINPASGESTEKDAEAITNSPPGSSSAAPREVEPLESSFENEISKHNEDTNSIYDNVESFDEEPMKPKKPKNEKPHKHLNPVQRKEMGSEEVSTDAEPTTIDHATETVTKATVTQKSELDYPEQINEWDNIEPFDSIEDDNEIESHQQPYRDLSNDILVNQYMADAGAPMNPWAENINTDDVDAQINLKTANKMTGGHMYHK